MPWRVNLVVAVVGGILFCPLLCIGALDLSFLEPVGMAHVAGSMVGSGSCHRACHGRHQRGPNARILLARRGCSMRPCSGITSWVGAVVHALGDSSVPWCGTERGVAFHGLDRVGRDDLAFDSSHNTPTFMASVEGVAKQLDGPRWIGMVHWSSRCSQTAADNVARNLDLEGPAWACPLGFDIQNESQKKWIQPPFEVWIHRDQSSETSHPVLLGDVSSVSTGS